MSAAFYNENDPKAAAWLRELIKEGHIAPGIVSERSITDLSPTDLDGFTQCHFFAGIGGWSHALRLAGIPDSVPVWTGSCPCQPFSAAGQGKGTQDDRHLWPSFARLIDFCRPATVFGEQVASKDGRTWLAGVFADLEGMGYLRAGADLCAAGIGAPHIRQRLYWLAYAGRRQRDERTDIAHARHGQLSEPIGCGAISGLADTNGARPFSSALSGIHSSEASSGSRDEQSERLGAACGMGNAEGERRDACGDNNNAAERNPVAVGAGGVIGGLEHTESYGWEQRRAESGGRGVASRCFTWDSELLNCTDGKARRIEPGSFPLAHGIPGRVGLLRGYGNAIVPQVAAQFIRAYFEAREAMNLRASAPSAVPSV